MRWMNALATSDPLVVVQNDLAHIVPIWLWERPVTSVQLNARTTRLSSIGRSISQRTGNPLKVGNSSDWPRAKSLVFVLAAMSFLGENLCFEFYSNHFAPQTSTTPSHFGENAGESACSAASR